MIYSRLFHCVKSQSHKNSTFANSLIWKWTGATVIQAPRRSLHYRKLFFWKISDAQMKKKDKVESNYQLVYKAGSMHLIKYTYFIAATSAIGLSSAFILSSTFRQNILFLGTPVEICVAALFSLTIQLSIFYLSQVYVTRMYYNEDLDKYIAILTNRYPYENRQILISPGEPRLYNSQISEKIKIPFMIFQNETHVVQSKKVVWVPEGFSRPYYYSKLMGYVRD